MSIEFNLEGLKALPHGKTRQPVTGQKQLYINQNESGFTFLYRYRSPETLKYRYKKIASFKYGAIKANDLKDVSSELSSLNMKVLRLAIDPIEEEQRLAIEQADKKRNDIRLQVVFDAAMERKKDRAASTLRGHRLGYNHILKYFDNVPVSRLSKDGVKQLLDKVSRGMHDKVLDSIRMIEMEMIERGILEARSLTFGITPKGSKHNNVRVLPEELPGFIEQLQGIWSPIVGKALMFQLLTGCRIEEVCGARWDEIQTMGDSRVWVIPPERIKTSRKWDDTKPYSPHVLPVTPLMAEILLEQRRLGTKGYIFPSSHSGKAITNNTPNRYLKAMTPSITTHGIRKTVADAMFRLFGEEAENLILNHSVKGVSSRYIEDQAIERKRKYLIAWHDELAECGLTTSVTRMPLTAVSEK